MREQPQLKSARRIHSAGRVKLVAAAALPAAVLFLACADRAAVPAASPSPRPSPRLFDGRRALTHVRRLVALGPRPAGSPALNQARAYLAEQLRGFGLTVREDRFTATTPLGPIEMANLVAELPGASPDVLVVASHFDTKRLTGFVGANDGGSSTGVVLELARVLAASQHAGSGIRHTLWFTFFDGEEAVVEWSEQDSLYGSRHMVDSLRAKGQLGRIKAVVLLDMVGDRDLAIPREATSTPWLMDLVLNAAVRLGHAARFPPTAHAVTDDHTPFLRAGIPAVDLIDYSYGTDWQSPGPGGPTNAWWHTANDTLDKISAESLQVVGDVVLAALPEVSARLSGLTPSAAPAT